MVILKPSERGKLSKMIFYKLTKESREILANTFIYDLFVDGVNKLAYNLKDKQLQLMSNRFSVEKERELILEKRKEALLQRWK